MSFAALFAVIGALLLLEGVMLLLMREESWRRFRELLGHISIGQLHTIGIVMVVCGVLLLIIS